MYVDLIRVFGSKRDCNQYYKFQTTNEKTQLNIASVTGNKE